MGCWVPEGGSERGARSEYIAYTYDIFKDK